MVYPSVQPTGGPRMGQGGGCRNLKLNSHSGAKLSDFAQALRSLGAWDIIIYL